MTPAGRRLPRPEAIISPSWLAVNSQCSLAYQPPMARSRWPDEFDQAATAQVLQVAAGGLFRALEVVSDVSLPELNADSHLLDGPLLALVVFSVTTIGWGVAPLACWVILGASGVADRDLRRQAVAQ